MTTDEMPPGLVTLPEAAAALGLNSQTLRKWAQYGRIRAWRAELGHRTFVDLEEVRRKIALQPLNVPGASGESGGDA